MAEVFFILLVLFYKTTEEMFFSIFLPKAE